MTITIVIVSEDALWFRELRLDRKGLHRKGKVAVVNKYNRLTFGAFQDSGSCQQFLVEYIFKCRVCVICLLDIFLLERRYLVEYLVAACHRITLALDEIADDRVDISVAVKIVYVHRHRSCR